MSGFWRFGRKTAGPPPAEAPAAAEFHSRGLQELLSRRPPEGWRVLDLGPASHVNLTFFAGLGARYTVEELYRTIAPCRAVGKLDPECVRKTRDLFAFDEGTGFDAVLAWDLLDHLGPEGVAAVVERLAPFCRPGTLMHALVSRDAAIAAHPQRFEVVGEKTIRAPASEGRDTRPSPRFRQPTLAKVAAPFVVDRAFLLKQGLDEYLLEWRPSPPAP